ncbi:MATE family efflux transporter [Clostridium hydrogeniformans]|uniref:MATE family efflux transporter n=1 Tax=Clostridium hydrogeniformans TaxID=349933 RepID=UPI00048061F7|nr:MATE family efflux transporter [Clostridium hydrogeniformans]
MRLNKETARDVLKLALPAVGEMVLYMMIWVFDTMMVGWYGGNLAVSSVGLSSEIMYTFSNVLIAVGISIGVTSLVARRIGAKETHLAEEYATLGFCVTAIISFILCLTTFTLSSTILTKAGANAEVVALGSPYMKITSFGIFFNMLMNSLNATLRGSGNTKIPLYASALVNVINIFLDYGLIFGKFGLPELGVKGAALATSIAQICGFLFILYYTVNKASIKIRLKYLSDFKGHMLSDLLKLSIPSSLQEGSLSISRLICNFLIIALGTIPFAANQITTTIESISFMPGWGVAIAATTLVGHKIGEKNYAKAKEYAYTSIFIGTGLMLICSFIFLVMPNLLISLFISSSETEVIKLGGLCIMIAALEQPFMAVSMIAGGALKGAGNTKTPFVVSFLSSWVIRLPLMIYFIYYLKLSVTYVWIITAVQWAFDGILVFILFRKYFKNFNLKVHN